MLSLASSNWLLGVTCFLLFLVSFDSFFDFSSTSFSLGADFDFFVVCFSLLCLLPLDLAIAEVGGSYMNLAIQDLSRRDSSSSVFKSLRLDLLETN